MFLDFDTIENIRDLGGIKTRSGLRIKEKRLLRSSALHQLSIEELTRLKQEFNLKTVIDFRSTKSSRHKKDLLDDSIAYYHTYVLAFLETNSYDLDIKMDPDEFFKYIYRSLANQPEATVTYRQFFRHIIETSEGAILWHCTSGKDRTGIATALLLHVLGCDLATIYEEHFLTNKITYPLLEKKLQEIGNEDKSLVKYYEAFFIAKREYIDEYFNEIIRLYGNLDAYINNELQVNDQEVSLLRARYLDQ